MDAIRVGRSIRALRRHHGWTQRELGFRASVSQAAVSRAERGLAGRLTLRAVDRIAEALGARVTVRLSWHGEELDRLLDAAHAALIDTVVRQLRAEAWEAATEVTFSIFGERGSIDVLALHRATHALLVIEVKSAVPDLQSLLAGVDRKARLAAKVAADRGWQASSVSRLVVVGEDRTNRRRLAEHAATMDVAFPCRGRAVRSWVSKPVGSISGVLFVTPSQRTTPRHRIRARQPSNSRGTTREASQVVTDRVVRR